MVDQNNSTLARAFRNSRIGEALSVSPSSVRNSAVAQAVRVFARSAGSSRFHDTTEYFSRITQSSFLYRWLTAEPDPDVVIIDLSETWTAGPIIAILDRTITRTSRYWTSATIKSILDRTANVFAGSTVAVSLVRVLESPELLESPATDEPEHTDGESK